MYKPSQNQSIAVNRVVSRSATPSHALLRLLTPCNAFPTLNVQLAKQPTASGVFLPPRADAHSGAMCDVYSLYPVG
ncbi:hypothetical protein GBA52_020120 [Prunus armeniaca]|nr:hypothetical protein GBA52_020120 [Prunus armeniaca]